MAKSPGGIAREALKSVQFERSLKAVPFAEVKLDDAAKAELKRRRDRAELEEIRKAEKELFGW